MKRFLLLTVLILASSVAFGQFTKQQFYSKIDGLSNYNIAIQRSFWDSLVVSVPFIENPGDFLVGNTTNSATGSTIINGGNTGTLNIGHSFSQQFSTIDFGISTAFRVYNSSNTEIFRIQQGATEITLPFSGSSGDILTSNGDGTWSAAPAAGSAAWGDITGTLSDQTDLQSALDLKANLASPAFTGTPTAPTPTAADNSTKLATTAYVDALTAATSGYFPVANGSGILTAVPMSGDMTLANTGAVTLATDRWKLTGSSTSTGAMTIGGGNDLTFNLGRFQANNTFTTTANNQGMNSFGGTITARNTSNDLFALNDINGIIKSGTAGQNGVGLWVRPTFDATNGAFTTTYLGLFDGSSGDVAVSALGGLFTTRGISMTMSSEAGANTLLFNTGTATITNNGNNTASRWSLGSYTTQGNPFLLSSTIAPTSGNTQFWAYGFTNTVNQTGTANGLTTDVLIRTTPTAVVGQHTALEIGNSGSFSTTTKIGIDYNPTIGSVTNHYAALFRSGRVGIGTATPTDPLTVNGNVSLITAGSGLEIAEGSNATMGVATLTAGTVTVNTTKVTANSRIFLTVNGGTLTNVGSTYVSARSAGTSFTISSTNVLDASSVAWIIIEPN